MTAVIDRSIACVRQYNQLDLFEVLSLIKVHPTSMQCASNFSIFLTRSPSPATINSLTSTSSDITDVCTWLRANRLLRAFELSRNVHRYAPRRPFVLIVATQEAILTQLTEVSGGAKVAVEHRGGKGVAFMWMDGFKEGSAPVIVVRVTRRVWCRLNVCSGWCTTVGRIRELNRTQLSERTRLSSVRTGDFM